MPTKPGTFHPPQGVARGNARQRGYTSQWDRAARVYRLAHPLCLGCQAVGQLEPTAVVDHVVPHEGDRALFWDEANWQPACAWHHDAIKQRLEGLWKAGEAATSDLRLDSALAQRLTLGR